MIGAHRHVNPFEVTRLGPDGEPEKVFKDTFLIKNVEGEIKLRSSRRLVGLDEDLDPVVRESVLDRVELHVRFGFACWFRSDELAVGVEAEMMKRAR